MGRSMKDLRVTIASALTIAVGWANPAGAAPTVQATAAPIAAAVLPDAAASLKAGSPKGPQGENWASIAQLPDLAGPPWGSAPAPRDPRTSAKGGTGVFRDPTLGWTP